MGNSSMHGPIHPVRAFLRRNRGPVILALVNLMLASPVGAWSPRAGGIIACSGALAGLVWWFSDSDEFNGATRRVAFVMVVCVMVASLSLVLTLMGLVMNSFHYVLSIIPQVALGVVGVTIIFARMGPVKKSLGPEEPPEDQPDDIE